FEGAKRVLLNVTGNKDLTLHEFNAIGNALTEKLNNPDANIIVGSVCDPNSGGKIKVSIFATDFPKSVRKLKGV
ncbi:MAG TPA: cell division protein FtsZ, partial [Alphaproteobacteria bacterium]|nr:cell division protein FtsZ [Alphaproteobacteria bacterium]